MSYECRAGWGGSLRDGGRDRESLAPRGPFRRGDPMGSPAIGSGHVLQICPPPRRRIYVRGAATTRATTRGRPDETGMAVGRCYTPGTRREGRVAIGEGQGR